MPFVKADIKTERNKMNKLINNNLKAKIAAENFDKQIAFQKELVKARRSSNLTQKDVSEKSGLSQQAVSRIEKGQGWNGLTLFKYLTGIGYDIHLRKI